MTERFDAMTERFDATEEKLAMRLDAMTERLDALEGVNQQEEGFAAMRLDAMKERLDAKKTVTTSPFGRFDAQNDKTVTTSLVGVSGRWQIFLWSVSHNCFTLYCDSEVIGYTVDAVVHISRQP
eukprot:GHVS01037367.1.p1 GENE.GHVS01037367.1~~GHVS01037367.1.p1  ORF type:complete len:124 (-),score=22.43 GHVS01037367.1:572-943(-)